MVWGEGVSKFETRNMFALKFVLGQLNLNLECGHGRVYKVPVVGYEGGGGVCGRNEGPGRK